MVRLDRWREDGLGQQMDDVEAARQCSKDRKKCKSVMHILIIEFDAPFLHGPRSFGPPSQALVDYHLETGGMPLHNMVGVNCNRAGGWYMG